VSNPISSTPLASFEQQQVTTLNVQDTIPITDTLRQIFEIYIQDTFSPYDQNFGYKLNSITFTEYLTFGEKISKVAPQNPNEQLAFLEQIDYALIGLNQIMSDSFILAETFTGQKIASRAFSDLFSLTDIQIRQRVNEPFDTFVTNETIGLVLVKTTQVGDSIQFDDRFSIIKPIIYSGDFIIYSENIGTWYPKKNNFSDTILINDQIAFRVLSPQYIIDELEVYDKNEYEFDVTFVEDEVFFYETLTRQVTYNLYLCDNSLISEKIGHMKLYTILDVLNFSDFINNRAFSDSLTFTDTVSVNAIAVICDGDRYVPDKGDSSTIKFGETITIIKTRKLSISDSLTVEEMTIAL
jgi:hypothetical protein